MNLDKRVHARLRFCCFLLSIVPLICSRGWAEEQTYPTKPIRLIVPFAPGGGNDIIARIVGQKLGESWGQQVVIDNRPGAGGNIAAEIAAHAIPDGYTLFQFNIANAIAPSIFRRLAYDPIKDFASITLMASAPFVLAVNPATPARSIGELIGLARTRPGTLTYASGGNGSSSHLAGELFRLLARIDIVHVPYKGGGPALIDLMAGQVTMYFASVPAAMPHLKAGRIHALAVTGARRSKILPDLPTAAEAGVSGYEASAWYGLVAPAGIPPAILRKLHAEIVRLLNHPDVGGRLESQGADVIASTPSDFARHIKSEVARWAQVVKLSGARVQ